MLTIEHWNKEIYQVTEKCRTIHNKNGKKFNLDANEELINLIRITLDWCTDNDIYTEKIEKMRDLCKKLQYSFFPEDGSLFIAGTQKGWYKDFIEIMDNI